MHASPHIKLAHPASLHASPSNPAKQVVATSDTTVSCVAVNDATLDGLLTVKICHRRARAGHAVRVIAAAQHMPCCMSTAGRRLPLDPGRPASSNVHVGYASSSCFLIGCARLIALFPPPAGTTRTSAPTLACRRCLRRTRRAFASWGERRFHAPSLRGRVAWAVAYRLACCRLAATAVGPWTTRMPVDVRKARGHGR